MNQDDIRKNFNYRQAKTKEIAKGRCCVNCAWSRNTMNGKIFCHRRSAGLTNVYVDYSGRCDQIRVYEYNPDDFKPEPARFRVDKEGCL